MAEVAGPVGAALGLAVASGLSLYGAVFVSGLAIRLGWVHLAQAWTSLGVLTDPVVLGVSAWSTPRHLALQHPRHRSAASVWPLPGAVRSAALPSRSPEAAGCRKSLEVAVAGC